LGLIVHRSARLSQLEEEAPKGAGDRTGSILGVFAVDDAGNGACDGGDEAKAVVGEMNAAVDFAEEGGKVISKVSGVGVRGLDWQATNDAKQEELACEDQRVRLRERDQAGL
jgi:hypothetical protein